MIDVLEFEFMRNALLAGLLVSVICGIIGTLVVVNRLVLLSGGIAHAAFGGIGLSFFLGLPVMAVTLCFSFVVALILAGVTLKAKHRSDTIVGVLWAVGMALGVIFLDLTPGYNVDLMSYLFGSILMVTQLDLLVMVVVGTMVLFITGYYYQDLLAMSYDEEFARLRNVPVKPLYFLLVCMIALSVVVIIRVVGLILIIALLTIPPYIAEKYARSLRMMMVFSVLLSCLFASSGLLLSYFLNVTSGAAIIMVAAAGFFISLLLDRLVTRRTSMSSVSTSN
ncbi:MAG: metal ABC transporter permease [Desulfobacterales bacterium]|jgi:zinc transport system permease protein|nr:metal ABC transporter permease [Desulfobacterales bacterium]MDP6683642.1 metal ABC transporter permease [Desulfobacterales bacterium]MDP6807847.1 metal ABC transporter permease [Desulfobacterales bacterium]|tara:strand:+ start:12708 stop:13547 length:840 start_codon:yes stop_codon:yes gene_type:complete